MRLAVASRQADTVGTPLDIGTHYLEVLRKNPIPAVPLLASADKVLLYLAERATNHFGAIDYDPVHDFTLLGFRSEQAMKDGALALIKLGYITNKGPAITIEGWKRIEELKASRPDSRKAFVAMWFDAEMEDAWLEGFKPGILDTEYFEPVRVDAIEHTGKIDDRIVAEIRTAGLLVADFTGHRGGVYYEAGFAAGLGLPVIWCCRKDHFGGVHFDVRQYNHIVWETPAELRGRLRDRILAVVPNATTGG